MTAKDQRHPKTVRSAEETVLDIIRAGYRERDAAKVMAAYAEDIEATIVNRNNPPSKPLVLRGKPALQRMVQDICSREMTHEITGEVLGSGSLAYRVECRYPDGCNVVGHYLSTLKDGRIARERSIDCWDE